MLTAGLLFAATVAQPLSAAAIIGEWRCERPAAGLSFVWRVEKHAAGPWLVGEAEIDGGAVAFDVWRIDDGGALGVRRQFGPDGSMIEMRPGDGADGMIKFEGVLDPGGRSIRMEESITFIDRDAFNAQWRYYSDGEGVWKIDSDETCRRIKAG